MFSLFLTLSQVSNISNNKSAKNIYTQDALHPSFISRSSLLSPLEMFFETSNFQLISISFHKYQPPNELATYQQTLTNRVHACVTNSKSKISQIALLDYFLTSTFLSFQFPEYGGHLKKLNVHIFNKTLHVKILQRVYFHFMFIFSRFCLKSYYSFLKQSMMKSFRGFLLLSIPNDQS